METSNIVIEKLAELEDRSRRNNLRFDGILEDAGETWEDSEDKVRSFLQNKLDLKDEVKIERAHRSGKKTRRDQTLNDKRTVIVKFLNFKDKQNILMRYRERKLWESQLYVNEDFSEHTSIKRKGTIQKS